MPKLLPCMVKEYDPVLAPLVRRPTLTTAESSDKACVDEPDKEPMVATILVEAAVELALEAAAYGNGLVQLSPSAYLAALASVRSPKALKALQLVSPQKSYHITSRNFLKPVFAHCAKKKSTLFPTFPQRG